jgi:uncharacterized membrane protein
MNISSRNIAVLTVFGLVAAGLGMQTWYWGQLPDRIATHFGIDGSPNEWMSKANATLLLCGVQVGLPLLLLGIALSLSKIPNSLINIPNREYWLQADRREASLGHMQNMLAWIAVLVAIEINAIVHLTFLANRDGTGLNKGLFVGILLTFLAAIFTIAGTSMWRFRMPVGDSCRE